MKNWEIIDVDDSFTIVKDEKTKKIKILNNNLLILDTFNNKINSIVKRTKNKLIFPRELYLSTVFKKF